MPDAIQIESPECERMCAVAPYSQKIGEFLEWVRETHGAFLAVYDDNGRCHCFGKSPSELLAGFFEIDLNKVESERRAILAALAERGK